MSVAKSFGQVLRLRIADRTGNPLPLAHPKTPGLIAHNFGDTSIRLCNEDEHAEQHLLQKVFKPNSPMFKE